MNISRFLILGTGVLWFITFWFCNIAGAITNTEKIDTSIEKIQSIINQKKVSPDTKIKYVDIIIQRYSLLVKSGKVDKTKTAYIIQKFQLYKLELIRNKSKEISVWNSNETQWSRYPECDTDDIVLKNGQIWAACNIWATKAFRNMNDSAPDTITPDYDQSTWRIFFWGSNFWWDTKWVGKANNTYYKNGIVDTSKVSLSEPVNYKFLPDKTRYIGSMKYYETFTDWNGSGNIQWPCATWYHIPSADEWTYAYNTVSNDDMPYEYNHGAIASTWSSKSEDTLYNWWYHTIPGDSAYRRNFFMKKMFLPMGWWLNYDNKYLNNYDSGYTPEKWSKWIYLTPNKPQTSGWYGGNIWPRYLWTDAERVYIQKVDTPIHISGYIRCISDKSSKAESTSNTSINITTISISLGGNNQIWEDIEISLFPEVYKNWKTVSDYNGVVNISIAGPSEATLSHKSVTITNGVASVNPTFRVTNTGTYRITVSDQANNVSESTDIFISDWNSQNISTFDAYVWDETKFFNYSSSTKLINGKWYYNYYRTIVDNPISLYISPENSESDILSNYKWTVQIYTDEDEWKMQNFTIDMSGKTEIKIPATFTFKTTGIHKLFLKDQASGLIESIVFQVFPSRYE